MNHTREPWEIQHDNYLNRPCNIRSTKNGQLLGWTVSNLMGTSKEEADANAERIVACVNACKGLTNEVLGKGILEDAIALVLNAGKDIGVTWDDVMPYYEGVKVWEEEE